MTSWLVTHINMIVRLRSNYSLGSARDVTSRWPIIGTTIYTFGQHMFESWLPPPFHQIPFKLLNKSYKKFGLVVNDGQYILPWTFVWCEFEIG